VVAASVLALVAASIAVLVVRPWGEDTAGRPQLTNEQRDTINQLVSVLMHDTPVLQYDRVVDQHDGRGYVMGRGDFATADGAALLVVDSYEAAEPGNPLVGFIPKLRTLASTRSSETTDLPGFAGAWRLASRDAAFRRAQDDAMGRFFFTPAINAATEAGIASPLAVAILFDTAVQHGTGTGPDSFGEVLRRTRDRASGTPRDGVDPRQWLETLLGVRADMLADPAEPAHAQMWPHTMGRIDALRTLLARGQEMLAAPVIVNPYGTAHLLSPPLVDPELLGAPTPSGHVDGPPSGAPSTSATTRPAVPDTAGVFFDDFAYSGTTDARFAATWAVRSDPGSPGPSGATWSQSAVTLRGSGPGATMVLTASTDGTAAGTRQAQVATTKTAFLEGTYAVRLRYAQPRPGQASVNQSFATISVANGDGDPAYSEMDVVYLPDGGRSDPEPRLHLAAWHTFTATSDDLVEAEYPQRFDGWQTVVITVAKGTVTYYVDGQRLFSTGGKYYPRREMQMLFNQWFVDGELGAPGATLDSALEVDFVYYARDTVLSPDAAQEQVALLRQSGTARIDSL
jgi:hypothetical protein